MLDNFNVYDEESWEAEFTGSTIHQQLCREFDLITFDSDLENFGKVKGMTSRHFRGIRIVSAMPFWFIDQIAKANKHPIYDLGCGWNLYKKYYNNIVGISGEEPDTPLFFGDEHGFVTPAYIVGNVGRFHNIITQNALHYITIEELLPQIAGIMSMCKIHGYVFIEFNICHMLNKSDIKPDELKDIAKLIRTQLEFLKYAHNLISFELIDEKIHKNFQEGTLRILVQKK